MSPWRRSRALDESLLRSTRLKRLGQFALVVFIGINIAFVVTHATPIDPVEQSIAAATAVRQHQPRGDRR